MMRSVDDAYQNPSSGEGLERSCAARPGTGDWIASAEPVAGVELFTAWFSGAAYRKHRHDTYAICLTASGVQTFSYRGARRSSTAGQVVVLHPDEIHDGQAGTAQGFGYRQAYVAPSRIAEAVAALGGAPGVLPFVSDPVLDSESLRRAILDAFLGRLEPLSADQIVMDLARGLLEAASRRTTPVKGRIDRVAVERARQFLDATPTRVVDSAELERVTGLSRYDLTRQFKRAFGTSPYRYLLMRRIALTRGWIHEGRPLAAIAQDAGFADQAHFTRVFGATMGMPPSRYRSLAARRESPGESLYRC